MIVVDQVLSCFRIFSSTGGLPNATDEEILHQNVCSICYEEMQPCSVAEKILSDCDTFVTAPEEPVKDSTTTVAGTTATPSTPAKRRKRASTFRMKFIQQHPLLPKRLPCGHTLHLACLRQWFLQQKKCPLCRQAVHRLSGRRLRPWRWNIDSCC